MKKVMILLIIIEILISTVVLVLKDSIIIGNYNENSDVYNIVSEQKKLPKNATIKCIIKNRFVFRNITYRVYYKTDRIHSTNINFELTSSYVRKLDSHGVGVEWYCILLITFTVVVFFIVKKEKH